MIITRVDGKKCFLDTSVMFDLPESELENVKTEPRMRITAQIEVQIDVDKEVSESVAYDIIEHLYPEGSDIRDIRRYAL